MDNARPCYRIPCEEFATHLNIDEATQTITLIQDDTDGSKSTVVLSAEMLGHILYILGHRITEDGEFFETVESGVAH